MGQMRADVDALLADLPDLDRPLRIYHELDPSYFSATSSTFIGAVYALAGLENIADAAGTDYPQLSAELILAEDPDIIFLADVRCCGQDADTVAARPGWGELSA
ncbi:ABC transporter substrate-binding protein, partial [Arthrospira platensis SPKY1]|nr:ABC transporter substrate-binding protein [Arthrospira platensis SPKY1]